MISSTGCSNGWSQIGDGFGLVVLLGNKTQMERDPKNDWGNNSSHSFQPSPFLGLLMKLEVEDANEFSGFESNLGLMSLGIGG